MGTRRYLTFVTLTMIARAFERDVPGRLQSRPAAKTASDVNIEMGLSLNSLVISLGDSKSDDSLRTPRQHSYLPQSA